jgi:Cu(I)/Ag(I) efflux system membrane fusion protein
MEREDSRGTRGIKGNDPKRPLWVKPAAFAIVTLIICLLAVYRFVPSVHNVIHRLTTDNDKGKKAERVPAVKYTCPMHPFIVSDRPGACPICGMSLVPKESKASQGGASITEAHLPGGVSLSPTQRVMANVVTTKVDFHEFSMDTVAVGKVSWDERRLTRISARIAGRVERLHVNFTGARVNAGQALLDIYSPDLVTAQKEYLLAIEGAERAKDSSVDSRSMMEGLRDASRSRLKLWGFTDAQIAELTRTGRPKVAVTVFSPAAGVVTERLVTTGQYVNEGAPLFSVALQSSVWVEAELYENEIGRVAVGTPAVVTTEAYPGKTLQGRVAFVDPVVNPETRTLKVRVDLANPGGLLKAEMFVKVALKGRNVKALAVPEGAVIVTGDRALAWIETAPGAFEPRYIAIGRKGEGFCEIVSGLSKGETVAASGGFLIDSESQLKSAQTETPHEREGKGR